MNLSSKSGSSRFPGKQALHLPARFPCFRCRMDLARPKNWQKEAIRGPTPFHRQNASGHVQTHDCHHFWGTSPAVFLARKKSDRLRGLAEFALAVNSNSWREFETPASIRGVRLDFTGRKMDAKLDAENPAAAPHRGLEISSSTSWQISSCRFPRTFFQSPKSNSGTGKFFVISWIFTPAFREHGVVS